jgi:hypothetical protein
VGSHLALLIGRHDIAESGIKHQKLKLQQKVIGLYELLDPTT